MIVYMLPPAIAEYNITDGHRPFSVQNVAKAIQFCLLPDKTADRLQIIAYINSHLHFCYSSVHSIVNIITAMQAIVFMHTTYIVITLAHAAL